MIGKEYSSQADVFYGSHVVLSILAIGFNCQLAIAQAAWQIKGVVGFAFVNV